MQDTVSYTVHSFLLTPRDEQDIDRLDQDYPIYEKKTHNYILWDSGSVTHIKVCFIYYPKAI